MPGCWAPVRRDAHGPREAAPRCLCWESRQSHKVACGEDTRASRGSVSETRPGAPQALGCAHRCRQWEGPRNLELEMAQNRTPCVPLTLPLPCPRLLDLRDGSRPLLTPQVPPRLLWNQRHFCPCPGQSNNTSAQQDALPWATHSEVGHDLLTPLPTPPPAHRLGARPDPLTCLPGPSSNGSVPFPL